MHDQLPDPADNNAKRDDNALPLADEAATLALGAALAPLLVPGLKIFLEGDLGAGKTTLVRGLLRALGHTGKVKSPTYTLVELYAVSGLNLYHFDFYRFKQPEEYLEAGLDEYFQGDAICIVEWPEQAGSYLPGADLRLRLELLGEGRQAYLDALTPLGRARLPCLKTTATAAAICSNSPPR